MSIAVELICTGTELLTGKTPNTNSCFLAKRITSLGGEVKRITTVGDDVNAIASSVRESLARKPSLIIVTGGLGPTLDDKTLKGISVAINRRLTFDRRALSMIKARYREMIKQGLSKRIELTPSRTKMAFLPAGSKAIPNRIGTAPGISIEYEGTAIVALPGVPNEMQAMFEESVVPIIRSIVGVRYHYEEFLHTAGILESDLAPLMEKVMLKNPDVYIKSHPKMGELESKIEVHFSAVADSPKVAKSRVKKALRMLSQLIRKKSDKMVCR